MKINAVIVFLLFDLVANPLFSDDMKLRDAKLPREEHSLITLIDLTAELLQGFALNASQGRYSYESCPLALSFYKEGVSWRVTNIAGEEALLNYLTGMHIDADSMASILAVLNAMDLPRKREILTKWRDSIPANSKMWNNRSICPRLNERKTWEWIEMSLRDFFDEVIKRTPE